MESAATSNAFRVLSLPADAAMKDIYRQQQRLLNSLEIGNPESLIRFRFLNALPLGTEILLEAVHRLEQQRMLEEIFWVHDLDNKIDFSSADRGLVISSLRSDAKLNTVRGAVARHNLAVILHYFALECTKIDLAFDYWNESLSLWSKTFAEIWRTSKFLKLRSDMRKEVLGMVTLKKKNHHWSRGKGWLL